MRIQALFTLLLSTTALVACDTAEPVEPNREAEIVSEEADEPIDFDNADTIVSEPDVSGDVTTCANYYFATTSNDAKKTSCMAATPAPNLPVLIDWEDLMEDELGKTASATCAAMGATDGGGNLPGIGGGLGGGIFPGFPGGLPAAPDGAGDLVANADTQEAGGMAQCASICAAAGKQWNVGADNFGTCAFDLTYAINNPKHKVLGGSCPGPGTRKWTSTAAVVFDCGCDCI